MENKTILIVDDDEGLSDNLEDILKDEGYLPFSAANCSEALKIAHEKKPKAALLDLKLPDGSGTDLLSQFKRIVPDCPCIMMTAFADLDSALLAIEQGAFQYLQKPVRPMDLLNAIKRLFETVRLRDEKRKAESELRQSETTIRSLLDAFPAAAFLINIQSQILAANKVFAQMLGKEVDEILGEKLDNFAQGELLEQNRLKAIEVVTSGEAIRYTIEAEGRYYDNIVSPLFDEQGHVNRLAVYSTDITDKKQSQLEKEKLRTQLVQSQKMEAMGTLAGGIAHDFNNILMGIQGNASLILIEKDTLDPDYERLKNIEQLVKNGSDLTKQLLGFAKGGRYEVKTLDINEIVRMSIQMFGRTKKEITCLEKYQDKVWTVEADRGQLEQVLLNLYVNAGQAMPGGGKILLETANVVLDENAVASYGKKQGKYVKIAVTDTGVGMDEATRQRIFDPFFTTKEMGRGTGLGLASVYGIVENHGGIVNVSSEIGKGSTFTVLLPASDKPVVKVKEKDTVIRKGDETLLLVDDEEVIIDVGSSMLQRMGYRVLAARSGEEALEIYKHNQSHIGLVILDMIMPEMSGGETYERLKEINPEIKVLLSSGYSMNGQATDILDRGCNGFIQKPFKMKDLSKKLRDILDKGAY